MTIRPSGCSMSHARIGSGSVQRRAAKTRSRLRAPLLSPLRWTSLMATVPVWMAWMRMPVASSIDDMSSTLAHPRPKVNDVSCNLRDPMEAVEELRYLILAAQREGARALAELLRPAGLTAAQGEVIAVLQEAKRPLTVREIGERLVCETGSPSRLVASLVDAGLLQRG